VGFVVAKGRKEIYVPGVNVASEPENFFITRPEDWVQAQEQGELIAFVHSHPNMSAAPSQADRVACEAMAEYVKPLEWLIVSVMPGAGTPQVREMESSAQKVIRPL
jgi:proteasome lid subunit RPN8/RPN11